MACGRNGGYSLDQLLQIVSQLEGAGLLGDFLRSHPQYAIGVEVARQIMQRGRTNAFANTRGLGAPGQAAGMACCQRRPVAPPAITFPGQQLPCCRRPGNQQTALAHSQRGTPHVLAAGPPGTNMMSGPLLQRLTQIQEPPPCLLQHPGDHPHVNFPPPPRVNDGLTLAQRLARIPEPSCQTCQQIQMVQSNCPYFGRTAHSAERDTDKWFVPVAAGYSDGIGGHKIKGFPSYAKNKGGTMDGVGGRKVKSFDED